jgi:phenylalanyl-tRNA synthetase beta chain
MPTVTVKKLELFRNIGRSYSISNITLGDEEFANLCFEFGIELDEVTSEREIICREKGEEYKQLDTDEILYKIEVSANRYDLVSLEGLSVALSSFIGNSPYPDIKLKPSGEKIMISDSVRNVRPFIRCAILRNIKFTEESLIRFIEIQDKFHATICK